MTSVGARTIAFANSALLLVLIATFAPDNLATVFDRLQLPVSEATTRWIGWIVAAATAVVFGYGVIRLIKDAPTEQSSYHSPASMLEPAPSVTTDQKALAQIMERLQRLKQEDRYSVTVIDEAQARLGRLASIATTSDVPLILREQHQTAVESERFYERTIWQIASVLLPSSLALSGYGMKPPESLAPIAGGFIIYCFFLFLFSRFRISLRLFREYAIFVEDLLGLYSHTYVYQTRFGAFGSVIRVWTVLVAFGALYVNFITYVLLR